MKNHFSKKAKHILASTAVLSTVLSPTCAHAHSAQEPSNTAAISAVPNSFHDIEQAAPWAVNAIGRAKNLGLLEGGPDGHFHPQKSITRQETAALLARLFRLEAPQVAESSFADVSPSLWSVQAIEAVKKAGFMNGDPQGKFRPLDDITREEMAAVLAAALRIKTDEPERADSILIKDEQDISGPAKSAVHTVMRLGLMQGDGEKFSPKQSLKRQEMSVIALRLYDKIFNASSHFIIDQVTNDQTVIRGIPYSIGNNVKGLLNKQNASALQGAKIRFVNTEQTITKITYLELKPGAKMEVAQNSSIPDIVIHSNTEIHADGTLTLPNLTIAEGAKGVTLNVSVADLYIPLDVKPEDVILNFGQIKHRITRINGKTLNHYKETLDNNNSSTQSSTGSGSSDSGGTGSGGNKPTPVPDTTAPTVTLSTYSAVTIGEPVIAQSNEPGALYLVPSTEHPVVVSELNQLVTEQRARMSVVSAVYTDIPIPTAGLLAGSYKVYGVDQANNLSKPTTNIELTAATNDGPELKTPIANQKTVAGGPVVTLDLSDTFIHADGVPLTLTASSSDHSLVEVAVLDNKTLAITPIQTGNATVTVYAEDSHGHRASTSFHVTVAAAVAAIKDQFPDPHLAQAVAGWLGKSVDDPLSTEDIEQKLAETSGVLDLKKSQISDLTGFGIFNGTRLTVLDLSSNQLASADISGLSQLESAILSNNKLEIVHLGALQKINELYLTSNELTTLDVTGLTNLKELYASGNQLKSLDVSQLKSLVTLNVNQNQLEALEVHDLKKLMRLNADHNKLKSIAISGLPELRSFKVEDNFLTKIPGELPTFLGLSETDISMNLIGLGSAENKPVHDKLNQKAGNGVFRYRYAPQRANYPPTVVKSIPNQTAVAKGDPLKIDLSHTFADDDGDELMITASSSDEKLATAALNQTTLIVTPLHAGTVTITLTAKDGKGGEASTTFNIEIKARIPTIEEQFKDPKLAQAIANWLGKSTTSTITTEDLNARLAVNSDSLSLTYKNISDLSGFEIFADTRLKRLDLSYNELTSADLSNLPQLVYVSLHNNKLTAINLSGLQKLETAELNSNQLTDIDIKGLKNLQDISLYLNRLTSLDASGLAQLRKINANLNKLQSITLTGAVNLEILAVENNALTALNVTGLPRLKIMYARINQLSSFEGDKVSSIEILDVRNNNLSMLHISQWASLKTLNATNNQLTFLDLSHLSKIEEVTVDNNILTDVDLTGNTSLRWFGAQNNLLTRIPQGLKDSTKLYGVIIKNNPIDFNSDENKSLHAKFVEKNKTSTFRYEY